MSRLFKNRSVVPRWVIFITDVLICCISLFAAYRAIAQAGPRTMVLLHRAADAALDGHPAPAPLPPQFQSAVDGYVAHARSFRPQGAAYLHNHRGHLMFVRPDERPFLSADLIKYATWTAPEKELRNRIGAIADAGFSQIVFSILPGQEHAIEDWGRIRAAFA